ncbi:Oidioi.mRNA.OKI2018_I69.chr1.g3631.t1.cds [Oikopleura dioica]|uniref:Oidioi.mRNA.OKI2018_I69.chr1.g3631.t1.cds n=1 Tax=Oikopleura dioica TaxID=34765 RepID=A0ABN7T1B0_OIKDI|nr:Oidioi.mRNA.OKI2018_I69.chr1.g3631.t1.cds [Oikopleura dioica]
MTSRHRPRQRPQGVPADEEPQRRLPDFRVGKFDSSSEPNEIHDLLLDSVGDWDSFSKTVPSIHNQEFRPNSSSLLGVVRMDSVPSHRSSDRASNRKPNDRKYRQNPTSSSSSPHSSSSGVASCASVEQLFRQMKLPDLSMSPFREPRKPPSRSITHHPSKHAAGQASLIKKPKPETIIASPDAMIAEPVRPRTDSRNNDGRSKRPQKIVVHQKAEVRPVPKETPSWVKIGYKRLSTLKSSGRNASNPLTMPDSLKRKIKSYAKAEGGKRPKIEKKAAKTKPSTKSVESKIEPETPPRQNRAQVAQPAAKPEPPKAPIPAPNVICPADSTSTSSSSLLPSKNYIQEAERIKEQAIEYMNNGDAILGYLAFTDAAAKFLIALHILFDEYEEHKKRNKGRTDEKHRSILHYTNAALEMCYKIRDNNAFTNLGASKSTFEKLSALGYKCEARLSLLYYKMNQGQHDYMRLHKDLTDVLQQKSARFTPTSPVRSELREHTLSEKEFRSLKTYLSGNQWLLKAHEKWDRGTNLATKNPGFFDVIGRLTEIRHLHLMCSLKDLSTFQSAAVKELRHRELHLGTSDASPLS